MLLIMSLVSLKATRIAALHILYREVTMDSLLEGESLK